MMRTPAANVIPRDAFSRQRGRIAAGR